MKKTLLLLGLWLAAFRGAFGCINEYHVTLKGDTVHFYGGLPRFARAFDREASRQYLDTVDLDHLEKYSFKQQSDIAVQLVWLGEYAQPLRMLQGLYRQHPGEYTLAANLGTLYELNGKPDSALFYIQRGMALNPKSHQGSEWVHVRILQAKLNGRKDPDWLARHSLLGLYAGAKKETPDGDTWYRDTIYHITYQLQERIPFTPAPDRLMARLLKEYADLLARELSIESAFTAYQMALVYDPADADGNRQKLSELSPLLKKAGIHEPDLEYYFPTDPHAAANGKISAGATAKFAGNSLFSYGYALGGSALLVGGMFFLYRRRRDEPEA
jgi:tetratricopeptide (TPR) repeat protein